jgi:mannose-6-phosphate isomerase-like protein (cupin superfamily)
MKISSKLVSDFLNKRDKKDIKVVVRNKHPQEKICESENWQPKEVILNPFCRVAYFTNETPQKKHSHPNEIEIYNVIHGSICIEIENKKYFLEQGDSIIVKEKLLHCVYAKEKCLVQVVSVGKKGKIIK